jgi:hypothetical protein
VLEHPPGREGIFGSRVSATDLVERIGLGHDTNETLTRRMLFLLESVALTGADVHREALAAVLRRYLDAGVRDQRVPRFLLSDLIRYWRTICVDFEGKARERGGEGWGLRNASCARRASCCSRAACCPSSNATSWPGPTCTALSRRPADAADGPGRRRVPALRGGRRRGPRAARLRRLRRLLDDEASRAALHALTREAAARDRLFRRVDGYGDQLESGLLALLFERQPLARLVREYGIF